MIIHIGGQNVLELEKNFTSDKFPSLEQQNVDSAERIVSAQIPAGNGGIEDENDAPSTSGYAAAGLQFAVALVVFALGGDWLDGRLGTGPLFLLLGVFGGGAAAFYSMYRKLTGPHSRKPEKQ